MGKKSVKEIKPHCSGLRQDRFVIAGNQGDRLVILSSIGSLEYCQNLIIGCGFKKVKSVKIYELTEVKG